MLRQNLKDHSRIQINAGKTQIWNRGGHVPADHDVLPAAARREDPRGTDLVWRPPGSSCVACNSCPWEPLSTAECVQAQLQATVESALLSCILVVLDLQSAFCCSTAGLQSHICRKVRSSARFAGVAVFPGIGQLPHSASRTSHAA